MNGVCSQLNLQAMQTWGICFNFHFLYSHNIVALDLFSWALLLIKSIVKGATSLLILNLPIMFLIYKLIWRPSLAKIQCLINISRCKVQISPMAQVWSFSRRYKHQGSHSENRDMEVLIIAIPGLNGSFQRVDIRFNVLFCVLTS